MPSIIWKGHLTFGLVSIPVKLLRAARRERVRLHYVYRQSPPDQEYGDIFEEPAEPVHEAPPAPKRTAPVVEPPIESPSSPPVTRVRQALVTSSDEQPVSRSEVLRGYEVEPDRYVVLDRDELRGLQRRTSPNMEIVRSVKLSEIDPVFFETSYYVVPNRGGEKAYAILFKALRETGHVALARVGMYGREHVVIVRPGQHGILAHTMFYTDEIRFENYREELEAIIAKNAAQSQVVASSQTHVAAAPVVDILEALKKSLAMAKKPAASEPQTLRKAPGRVTDSKQRGSRGKLVNGRR